MPVVFMAFFDSVFSLTYFMIFAPQEFIERYRDTGRDIGAKIFVAAHMVVFSILLLYFILVLIFPRLSRIMRKNPRLFELLDEAYEKRLYESDNFFYSDCVLLFKKQRSAVVVFSDAVWIVKRQGDKFGDLLYQEYVVYTKNNKYLLDLMPLPENEKVIVFEALKKYCTKARWGYNKENLEYYKDLKKRKTESFSDR